MTSKSQQTIINAFSKVKHSEEDSSNDSRPSNLRFMQDNHFVLDKSCILFSVKWHGQQDSERKFQIERLETVGCSQHCDGRFCSLQSTANLVQNGYRTVGKALRAALTLGLAGKAVYISHQCPGETSRWSNSASGHPRPLTKGALWFRLNISFLAMSGGRNTKYGLGLYVAYCDDGEPWKTNARYLHHFLGHWRVLALYTPMNRFLLAPAIVRKGELSRRHADKGRGQKYEWGRLRKRMAGLYCSNRSRQENYVLQGSGEIK